MNKSDNTNKPSSTVDPHRKKVCENKNRELQGKGQQQLCAPSNQKNGIGKKSHSTDNQELERVIRELQAEVKNLSDECENQKNAISGIKRELYSLLHLKEEESQTETEIKLIYSALPYIQVIAKYTMESAQRQMKYYRDRTERIDWESTGREALRQIGDVICLAAQYYLAPEDVNVLRALSDAAANLKPRLDYIYRFPEPNPSKIEPFMDEIPIPELPSKIELWNMKTMIIPYRSICETIREETEQLCAGEWSICGKLIEKLKSEGYQFVQYNELATDDKRRIDYCSSIYGVSYPGLYYRGNDDMKGYCLINHGGIK